MGLPQSVVYALNANPKRFPEQGLVSSKHIYVQQAIHRRVHLQVTSTKYVFDVAMLRALKVDADCYEVFTLDFCSIMTN